ncbi:RNA-binding S4 domain-containing protein [Algibacillus agarilyticus]|uniref:RNA-binding S4 domain-containing protein n=1 Tax=Algibacillus agarilyticus TaxID=2234133 RepID=UPI000DD0B871|nr:RNA-binding S4 domain-containing protein [Algibacillus agarilyticus]
MSIIYINREPVELYKILKFENLVEGGGEAKILISEGYVAVNGEIETQKRKKIYDGDVIEFDELRYEIKREEGVLPAEKPSEAQQAANKKVKQEQDAIKAAIKPRRGSIKF